MFSNILVAVDGSAAADKGLRHAIALAAQQRASLTILHVLSRYLAAAQMQMAPESLYASHVDAMRRQGRQLLDRAATMAQTAGVTARTVLREADVTRVAEAITAEAAHGVDLLVLGTHGRRGLRRLMLGSDAELVLRTSPVPVLLVRCDEGDEPQAAAA